VSTGEQAIFDKLRHHFQDADLTNYPYHISILGTETAGEPDDVQAYQAYRKAWKEYPEQFYLADFPLCLDLESAFVCNLRCVMCYIHQIEGYDTTPREKHFLPTETAFKLIDEGREHGLPSLKLTGRGEPLLNRDLERIISHAKKSGVLDVLFNTNATLLTEERAKKLIHAGLDQIIVSLDGATAETYNRIRIGSNYNRVIRNIETFLEIRQRMGRGKPRLQVQMVCMQDTVQDIVAFVDRWRPLANRVNLIRYKDYTTDNSRPAHLYQTKFRKVPCRQLWQRLLVTSTGDIHMCCGDFRMRHPIGNVREHTLHQVWHGRKLNAIRRQHRDGRFDNLPLCQNCPSNLTADFWAFLDKDGRLEQRAGGGKANVQL
jgi:radical SAM protein with 4Fe4S-binding SPASM domain